MNKKLVLIGAVGKNIEAIPFDSKKKTTLYQHKFLIVDSDEYNRLQNIYQDNLVNVTKTKLALHISNICNTLPAPIGIIER